MSPDALATRRSSVRTDARDGAGLGKYNGASLQAIPLAAAAPRSIESIRIQTTMPAPDQRAQSPAASPLGSAASNRKRAPTLGDGLMASVAATVPAVTPATSTLPLISDE